jgi:hypothetical protein
MRAVRDNGPCHVSGKATSRLDVILFSEAVASRVARRIIQFSSHVLRKKKFACRLVHAITPLEENKSFLEKVQLGEKLCGIASEASLLASWRPPNRSPLGSEANVHYQKPLQASRKCLSDEDLESDEDDEFSSVTLNGRSRSAIRWQERPQRLKAKLMPSFTTKSIENCCPTESLPKFRPQTGKESFKTTFLKTTTYVLESQLNLKMTFSTG